MIAGPLSEDDVLRLIAKIICEEFCGTHKDFAKAVGISPQHLCDILYRRRSPGHTILEYMGLEKIISYRIKDDASVG
jgi:hypothetical protein